MRDDFMPYAAEVRSGLMNDTTSTTDCLDYLMSFGFSSRLLAWWMGTQGPLKELYDFVREQLARGSSVEEVLNWFKTADEALLQAEEPPTEAQTEVTPEAEAEPTIMPKLAVTTAAELQRMDLPPVQFVVEGLLPHGLCVLSSPPKYGKSWMMLDLGLAVSTGRNFMGYAVNRCGVLYFALEDSYQRLKTRMQRLLNGATAPDRLATAIQAHDLDNGLLDELGGYLDAHPDTHLVIIDTFQRIRGSGHGGRNNAYAEDYAVMAKLKAFADSRHICLLLVHHLRKMADEADPFNRISGSTGILGAVDTALVLTKETRGAETATLSVVGRDVESAELSLKFDAGSCTWCNLGDAVAYAEAQARAEYAENPVIITVKRLISQSPQKVWSGTMKELLQAGEYIARTSLAPTAQRLSEKFKVLDNLLLSFDGIVHERNPNGNAGYRHTFRFVA